MQDQVKDALAIHDANSKMKEKNTELKMETTELRKEKTEKEEKVNQLTQ